MVFSSLVFLYAFLPAVLVIYYLIPRKFKNTFLFIASLLFFAWGGVSYSFILIFSLIFNYFIGKGIAFRANKKLYLAIGIAVNILVIGIFKYAGFLLESINPVLGILAVPTVNVPEIVLPIGISFYTFQAISYLIDIYRNEAQVQKRFINVALYISLFPQLIAGPIVRYHDIAMQLKQRIHSFERMANGIMRFTLGLGKKVLIANNMAVIADYVFSLSPDKLTFSSSWIGLIAYTFQIYFDFSGYSDMAIGLGRMFGFEIRENFIYPYISKSVREFWRRWHISLSNWFRDYLYISMGGNRVGKYRVYFNLFFVFFITGLWHGASWNFVVWGLIHGSSMIIERIGFDRWLIKLPKIIQNAYTLIIVMLAWVLFRADNFQQAAGYYRALFGFTDIAWNDIKIFFYLNRETLAVFIIAVLGSWGFFPYLAGWYKLTLTKINLPVRYTVNNKLIAECIFIVVVLFLSTTYLVNNTYNPFIYFRF